MAEFEKLSERIEQLELIIGLLVDVEALKAGKLTIRVNELQAIDQAGQVRAVLSGIGAADKQGGVLVLFNESGKGCIRYAVREVEGDKQVQSFKKQNPAFEQEIHLN